MNQAAAAALAGVAGVLAAVIAFTDAELIGATGTDRRDCAAIAFSHNGIPWKAAGIRAVGIGCDGAASVIRRYAEPRDCQFRATCGVGSFSCRTLATEGSTFTELCAHGRRSVHWHGSYVSS